MRAARTGPPRGLGRRGAAIFFLALAALGAFIYFSQRARPDTTAAEGRALWSRIPAGALLLAEIDLAALRKTGIGGELLGQGRDIAGLGEVRDLCGTDPLDALAQVIVVVPELEGVGFGLFASGSFEAEQMLDCAEKIVAARGGRAIRRDQPPYTILRDASLPAESAELAIAQDVLLLAEPAYMATATAVTANRSVASAGIHGPLRSLVPDGQMVVTMTLSEAQRSTLNEELKAQGEPDSPFGALRDGAASLSLDDNLRLSAVLRCDTAEPCGAIADRLRLRRDAVEGQSTMRLLGLSDILEAITFRADGPAARADLVITTERLLQLVKRLQLLEQLLAPPVEAPPPSPRAPPAGAPRASAVERQPSAPPAVAEPPRPEDGERIEPGD